MNLWLDDIRTPPTDRPWLHVRTVEECIAKIKRKVPQRLSLDNDLGEGLRQGYEVLDWLEERAFRGLAIPEEISVHSANPVARQRMQTVIDRLTTLAHECDVGGGDK